MAQLRSKGNLEDLKDKQFRHQTHSELFQSLFKIIPQELNEQLKELERYVKSREDKIKMMTKEIYQIKKELQNERNNSSSLLNEIANSCTAFEKLKLEFDSCKNELKNATEGFNATYKEKQLDKINFEKKISDLETNLNFFKDKNKLKSDQIELLRKDLKESEVLAKSNNIKFKEAIRISETLSSEKDKLKETNILIEGEKEMNDKRIMALEFSNKTISKELAESDSVNAKLKSIQTQLIEAIENKKVLPNIERLNFGEEIENDDKQKKGDLYMRLLEMEDFKVA